MKNVFNKFKKYLYLVLVLFGLAIILSTMIIRGIMYPFTKKTAMQSENMKKVQPELQKLEKKYANKTDQESMMQKSQEMMILYKKNNINPLSGCVFAFIQIPLLFAFIEEDSFFCTTATITPVT